MVGMQYRLHDVPITQITVGSDIRILAPEIKYYPEITYLLNATNIGEFIEKIRIGPGWGGEGEDEYHDLYFHALSAGYAVIRAEELHVGNSTDYIVKVVDENGQVPYTPPTANDDHVMASYLGTPDQLSHVLQNDQVPLLDTAINIETRSASSDIYFAAEKDWYGPVLYAFYDYYSASDTPVLGTQLGGEYRIQDISGTWSNWAKVYVDMIGLNQSRDHIEAYDTNDTIDFSLATESVGVYGLGGDDIIRGSQADDKLYGGDGNDRIGGKVGNDLIDGGNGNDTLFGDAGNDTIDGGTGDDQIWGGDGHDILRGGAGNDHVYGDIGDDQIGGKAGNDVLHGGDGNDNIWGDDGNDILYGEAGNDNLNGGAGNDILTGGLGIDRMRGEAGDDVFLLIRGEAQGDTILDFEGAGVAGGDKIEFRGYGKDATVHQVSGDTWQVDGDGITETFKIAGVSNLGALDFYFA